MNAHYPDDALCAQVGGELWFPVGGECRAAKRICAECPVSAECLEDALTRDVNPTGIWAGTTEGQRKKMRRRAA